MVIKLLVIVTHDDQQLLPGCTAVGEDRYDLSHLPDVADLHEMVDEFLWPFVLEKMAEHFPISRPQDGNGHCPPAKE